MPENFPDVWSNRVITSLNDQSSAPWLEGVPELDVEVTAAGEGEAGEVNEIHLPVTEFEPAVLINNTTYPLAVQAYEDDVVTIRLDKYQTAVTTISDDKIIGAAYPVIDAATKPHITGINRKKYTKALHALAPDSNTATGPVLLTTGDPVAAGSGQRLRGRYEDLVALGAEADRLGWPVENRRLVLSDDIKNDFLLDRKNFGDQLVNYKTGQPAPVVAGWQLYWDTKNPYYNGQTKLPFASVPSAGHFKGCVAFVVENIAKKTGMTKQYFAKADPDNQTNRLNYRHYFILVGKVEKYRMALVPGKSA